MTAREILPIAGPLNATVRVPGSKSLTNRALAVAALANGATTLTNAPDSDDSSYFASALKALGFKVEARQAQASEASNGAIYEVEGLGGRIPAAQADLFIGNAGTAARFLTAFVTLGNGDYLIDGVERMRRRPIADLIDALNALGANVRSVHGAGCPPVRVTAAGLPGGRAAVSGTTSSQFLSALLMVAPYARTPVELSVVGGLNSKPYVDMTLAVMADFGVTVERAGYERFCAQSGRYLARAEYTVESDASAASYFFAAPAILGGTVRVLNISRRSRQGDIGFLDVLEAMGCTVVEGDGWIEVTGPPEQTRGSGRPQGSPLRGVEVNLRDMPDTAQTLAAIAPFAATPTTIRGIASARVKETDRVAATCTELTRLGVEVTELPDGLVVQPCGAIRPAEVQTYADHRMAMSFALIGLRAAGVTIADPGCVSKTFPRFFDVLERLRS